MEVSEKKINNLHTFFIHQPGSKSASAQIWFRAGSSLEKKENQGIAHFLEHMFFKGSKKYPGTKIANTVESFGGEINAFTSFDYTSYYINAPQSYLGKSIDVLMDMVSNPLFLDKDFAPEKDVVFEEYRRSIDNPSQENFFQIQKTCFPKAYRHPILGTPKTIKEFSKKQLKDFRSRYYNTQNAFLIISGDLKQQSKFEKTISGYTLPSGELSSFSPFKLKSDVKPHAHKKHVNQVRISLTIQAPEHKSEDAPIEDLALNCLAYGENSPLYKELIHETSIANSVSGSSMFFSKGGVHFLKLTCPEENTDKLLKQFEKTIVKVLKSETAKDDVERIKNQYIASKIYEKESLDSFAFSLGHSYAQTKDLNAEETFIKRMSQVGTEDVNKALLNIFKRPIHINIQHPNEYKNADQIVTKTQKTIESIQGKIAKVKTAKPKYKIEESKHDDSVKLITLGKNLKLIYRHNTMTPTFVMHAYIKGGLSHEDESNNGIYHLIAKSLTNGHIDQQANELKTELEIKSSYLNGFSGKNAYGLTLHGLSQYNDYLFDTFYKTLLQPTVPDEYLYIEKELLKRNYHLQKEDALKQCFKQFNKLVFNGHPYSQDLIGQEDSIETITRERILKTHSETLQSSDIVLTYSGDLELNSFLGLIEPYIKKLSSSSRTKKLNKVSPINNQNIQLEFDREQTQIILGRSSYKVGTVEDLYLKIFTTYLSGQASELFVKVRDELGLCYAVQTLHHTALEAGYWGVYIGTGYDKQDQAIEAIQELLSKYQKRGLKQSEFNRIKKMIQGQNQLSLQTNDDYANYYSIPVLHNLGLDFQHTSFEKINKMKLADFNLFLNKFLKQPMNIVKAGRAS